MRRAREFDRAKYRDNPKAIAEYLNAALSTEDPFLITRAIRTMVHAQGMTRFSRKAGIHRDATGRWRDPRSAARYAHVVSHEEWSRVDLLPSRGIGGGLPVQNAKVK